MSMLKVVPPNSQDFLGECQAALVKVASNGVRGDDLRQLVKRAGAQVAEELRKVAMLPGEVPIHLIGLGATERYSINRNGDGFRRDTCRKYHDTFVKHAKLYRDHLNNDPTKSYGVVKSSWYNDAMDRVEMIVGVNGTKEAAHRNGGLVGDTELEKLSKIASGDPDAFPVSMSCTTNPEMPVLSSLGYKAIVDVKVDDVVLTHKGHWKKVTEINRRVYSGNVLKIRVKGLPFVIELTEDHPLFAAHRGEGKFQPDWLCVKHLEVGDLIDACLFDKLPGVAPDQNGNRKCEWDEQGPVCRSEDLGSILLCRDLFLSIGQSCSVLKTANGYEVRLPGYDKSKDIYGPIRSNGRFAYIIEAIETVAVENVQTYNFEVEDDNSYSMAGLASHNCRVSHDVCLACGNKARTRDEYCDEHTCKYGGAKRNMCKVAEDGTIIGVDNPDPRFFDISRVRRPADRTAYVFGQIKAAAAGVISGAELAETLGLKVPAWLDDSMFGGSPMRKLAQQLSSIEKDLEKYGARDGLNIALVPDIQANRFTESGGSPIETFAALTREKIAMPLDVFLQTVNGSDERMAKSSAIAVLARLPGIYTRMLEGGDFEKIASNPFAIPEKVYIPSSVQRWAEKLAFDWSLDEKFIQKRATIAVFRGVAAPQQRKAPLVKYAGDVDSLAKAYALYKLAFLCSLQKSEDFSRIAEMSIRQNYL